MNVNTILAIEAKTNKESFKPTWGNDWSNFTAEDIRKFENDCETKFNTDAEVKNCVAQKMGAASGKQGVNWGNIGTSAQQFLSGLMNNSGSQQTYTNQNYEAPKSNAGAWVIGILSVTALGFGIWYFGFRKK